MEISNLNNIFILFQDAIQNHDSYRNMSDSNLLSLFHDAALRDGLYFQEASRSHLRGLSSSTSSSNSGTIMNVILVLVCVICAGLASGLTQVI